MTVELKTKDGISSDVSTEKTDLRVRKDRRRRRAFPPLRFWLGGGRRRTVRRSTDRQRIVILDRYSPKLFAVIMGILSLSLLDALLTLYLIAHGSEELNPVMAYFYNKGPLPFIVAKYLFTSVAVLIFVALANSVVPRLEFRAKRLLSCALIAFGGVIVWEVILVYRLLF
jgi:hypothetical protein